MSASRRIRRRRFFLFLLFLLLVYPVGMTGARLVFPYPYREVIEREAARQGLDPLLVVAVMRTESGFDPAARSRAGARGLMQLMPSTAQWVAKKEGVTGDVVDRLEEPELNIRLGCWYLGFLSRQYRGDDKLALAAYNAGQGTVGRWQRANDELAGIYPETRAYVERGLWSYQVYRKLYREWGR